MQQIEAMDAAMADQGVDKRKWYATVKGNYYVDVVLWLLMSAVFAFERFFDPMPAATYDELFIIFLIAYAFLCLHCLYLLSMVIRMFIVKKKEYAIRFLFAFIGVLFSLALFGVVGVLYGLSLGSGIM